MTAARLKIGGRGTLTRRELAAAVSAAIAAPTLVGAASRLRIGIGTYTYHSLPFDGMIAQLTALGIREIEMSLGQFMLFSRPSGGAFVEVRQKLDRAAITCVSYYTATIKDETDLESALRFAPLLGARHVTGDATGPILQRIDERFTAAGLTFGIHNHWL